MTASISPKDPYDSAIKAITDQYGELEKASSDGKDPENNKVKAIIGPIIKNISDLTARLDKETNYNDRAFKFTKSISLILLKLFDKALSDSEKEELQLDLNKLEVQEVMLTKILGSASASSVAKAPPPTLSSVPPTLTGYERSFDELTPVQTFTPLPQIFSPLTPNNVAVYPTTDNPDFQVLSKKEAQTYIVRQENNNSGYLWVSDGEQASVFIVSNGQTVLYDPVANKQYSYDDIKTMDDLLSRLTETDIIDPKKEIVTDDIKYGTSWDEALFPTADDPAIKQLSDKNDKSFIIQKTNDDFGYIWVKEEGNVGVFIYNNGKVILYDPFSKQKTNFEANSFNELIENMQKEDIIDPKNEVTK